ncbi:hypothetical protein PRIPAC_94636 [Pristionchus pacificus]|uniref:Uncharacterized protein n=1 Tax=Pristionchus pacificus TaxID=54126 RepID=A0A2A6BRF7_PRIPA|nr:hypothetical protein PRIPAC_94636 [Pristionchus pacificus]|eukprot:PDM68406.1 hypothetical protein PRIPAC_46450 [Pristionchus pacificus]
MAVTQEPLDSQPINEGSTLRISTEIENDSPISQIEGERTFLSWLILPLLSLCSCGRGDKMTDEEEAIQPFPHTLDSPQCITQPRARTPPAIEIKSPIGAEASGTVVCVPVESPDYTTITRYEGYESEVRSGGDHILVNSSLDNVDHLHLLDLPLLPLLTICEFLFGDGSDCRDIYNFRNTCRAFAAVVNVFFQNPTKIPKIDTLKVHVKRDTMDMVVEMPSVNYVLHPMNSQLDFTTINHCVGKTRLKTIFNHEHGAAAIDRAADLLHGSVVWVSVRFVLFFPAVAVGVAAAVLRLFANVSIDDIQFDIQFSLNERYGKFIVSVLRSQSSPRASITFYQARMPGGGSEFLAELDSLTTGVTLEQRDGQPPLNLGLPFWQQWLTKKVQAGGSARCNFQPFTAHTDLAQLERPLKRIEWSE